MTTDWLKDETGFIENGFGIDPEDCGCTDCCVGDTFRPSDTWHLEAAIKQRRVLYNRSGQTVTLPNGYQLQHGETWRPHFDLLQGLWQSLQLLSRTPQFGDDT